MFDLTRSNINRNALAVTTDVSLVYAARGVASTAEEKTARSDLSSLLPVKASSAWAEWALSGYLGNFLEWAGEKLAEIGGEAFPASSVTERRIAMRENRRMLTQLFAESLIGEDVEQELHETLNLYLRHGLVLMKADILEPKKWRQELLSLQNQAKRMSAEEIAIVLSEWVEQLDVLQEKLTETENAHSVVASETKETAAYSLHQIGNRATDVPPLTQYPNPFELSSLDGRNGFQINGIATQDATGSVGRVGDVNGDGMADIIIGAWYASPNGRIKAGQSYVIFGKSTFSDPFELSSLNGLNGVQINGIVAGDLSGYSVSGAGDVNKDGFDDIIIGAFHAAPGGLSEAGQSYILFGKKQFTAPIELSELDGSNGFRIDGMAENDNFGISVSGAGDVNGDGYADFIIGARYASPEGRTHAGQSYVIFGQSNFTNPFILSDLNGSNGFQINGIANGDVSGTSVSWAGDVNKDGFDDVMIGAVYASPEGRSDAGQCYVIFGKANFASSIELSSLDGNNGFQINGIAGDNWAGSVAGAGDVNGDGYADMMVGAGDASPGGHAAAGQSYVILGQSTFSSPMELSNLNGLNGFQINGIASGDFAGSVSGAGDVNGDGYDDLLIGARYASPYGRMDAGQNYILFGRSTYASSFELSKLNGTNGFALDGINISDQSGSSVSSAGDLNGDGYDDILIGAPGASPNNLAQAGESYVVYGSIAAIVPSPPPKKQSHFERNAIIGGVLATGLLATGLFCFFRKPKPNPDIYVNPLDDMAQDERTPLKYDNIQ